VIPSSASRERLAALGIEVWVHRGRRLAAPAAATEAARPEDRSGTAAPRVRMASGDGDWLLVQDAPWDGRHDVLLGDIQATIGSAGCRFGQWANSDSAGVSVTELDSRGVRHVLAFGPAPRGADEHGIHLAPELSQLASSGEARRRLWQLLAAELED